LVVLDPATAPSVSVIIVARNEEANIDRCLAQIVGQDYPHERLEVIVVDGLSTDRTREIVKSFANRGVPVRVLTNPARGRTQGLNLAIRVARGSVIARVDARTVVDADYLRRCVQTLLATGADNVGGVQRPLPRGRGVVQRAIEIAMSHPLGVGGAEFRRGRRSGDVDTVYLGCFRRDVFERVGLFDETAAVISEDTDINYRIRQAGGRVYLNADVVAYYDPRDNFRDFWRLYLRYGGGKAGFLLKHRRLAAARQVALATFVGALGLLALASPFSGVSRALFAGLLAVYLTGNLVISTATAVRASHLALVPALSIAFACIHFGWGIGFLTRLMQRPRPGAYWGR
jgi:succinoglycan biosynthesis protein ExoA